MTTFEIIARSTSSSTQPYTPRVGDLLESPNGRQRRLLLGTPDHEGEIEMAICRKRWGGWSWTSDWPYLHKLVIAADVNHFGWEVIARGPEVNP